MMGLDLDSLMEILRTYGPSVIYALAILAVGWIGAGWVRRGVRAAMTRAKVDATLIPSAPLVAVGELGDSSVNLVVRPWCRGQDYWPLRFDLTRKLKEELEAAGCSIPFPQRDVHLHQAGKAAAAGGGVG